MYIAKVLYHVLILKSVFNMIFLGCFQLRRSGDRLDLNKNMEYIFTGKNVVLLSINQFISSNKQKKK